MNHFSPSRVLAAALSLIAPASAGAADARYDIDWRGIPIGEISFALDRGERQYRLSYDVRSTGFLALIFPFESRGYSSGLIQDERIVATTHSAISSVRGEARSWTVGFGLDGDVAHLSVQEDGDREPVPPALQRAPDPLALALTALQGAAPGAKLGGQSFDGRRAVKLAMICDEAAATAERLTCEVEGELLAGASKRWRDDEDDDDPPLRRPVAITLERHVMAAGGLGDGWWPVTLEVESRYGAVRATLARPLTSEAVR